MCVVVVWSVFVFIGSVCRLKVSGKTFHTPLGSWSRALCEVFPRAEGPGGTHDPRCSLGKSGKVR